MSIQTILRKRPLRTLGIVASASVVSYGFHVERQAERREKEFPIDGTGTFHYD